MDREKVICALENCTDIPKCKDCPWETCEAFDGVDIEVPRDLVMAVLELLRAQEPRVMTFEEVKQHYNLTPVFIDDFDMQEEYYQDIQPLYFEFPNPCAWDVHWRNSDNVRTYLDKWEDRYNKTWRCWTSRPTDAQREATPWN